MNLCQQVVWAGERLQRPSHGPARTQPRGLVQLLLSSFHHEDGPYACRPGSSRLYNGVVFIVEIIFKIKKVACLKQAFQFLSQA